MSTNEPVGEEETKPIQEDIEHSYRQYQQAHLYEELDDIAQEMERQLLQQRIVNILLDVDITPSPDATDAVRAAQEALGDSDLDRLETLAEDARDQVDSERDRITTQVQEARLELHDTVKALSALDETVGLMDSDDLSELEELLDEWNWEAEIDWTGVESLEDALEEAESLAQRMRSIFEEASDSIGEEFEGSEVQTLVERLLADGGMSITELDADELEALATSELADHIELSLG